MANNKNNQHNTIKNGAFYRKWWFWMIAMAILIIGAITVINLGENRVGNLTTTSNGGKTTTKSPAVKANDSNGDYDQAYQRILDEFSERLRNETPRLISEFEIEIQKYDDTPAEICDDLISDLAEINEDGAEQMRSILYSTGLENYDQYIKYVLELNNLFIEQSKIIIDTYQNFA